MKHHAVATLLALVLSPVAHAETINCTNITTLPATISTPGMYCLKQDASTAIESGAAIAITTNNVTLDCNGYRLGGLQAGDDTAAVGVQAVDRLNITVRNCNIRGFRRGVYLVGTGSGHLVENNRLDGNTYTAIHVNGDGATIRGNVVTSTGGSLNTSIGSGWTTAIESHGSNSILDNTIWGMTPMTGRPDTQGITVGSSVDGVVSGNRISGLGGTYNIGIRIYSSAQRVRVVGNNLSATAWGLTCDTTGGGIAKDNIIESGAGLDAYCLDAGGNFLVP